jgi:mono/diheme cytochrome c family protein
MALLASLAFFAPAGKAAASGEALFKKQCVMCHGADGAGNTGMGKTLKLRDLRSDEVQSMTDAQLSDVIAKGKGKMPGYEKNLGADGIQAVVGYLRELAKTKK